MWCTYCTATSNWIFYFGSDVCCVVHWLLRFTCPPSELLRGLNIFRLRRLKELMRQSYWRGVKSQVSNAGSAQTRSSMFPTASIQRGFDRMTANQAKIN